MFCGDDLQKTITTERLSDGKKVECSNIGLFKHYEDGRVIAVCRLCYRVSFSRRAKSQIVPDGWQVLKDQKTTPKKRMRIEKIYKTLEKDLKKDKKNMIKMMNKVHESEEKS